MSATPATRHLLRRRVDGVLLLDKPIGITSNTALMRIKRIYRAEKAGHTGTLDPLASGLLPICFGEATKFARFLLEATKRYRATIRFGMTTTTQDAEGDVIEVRAVTIDRAEIETVLPRFTGRIRQVPPAFSALKHRGRSHYEYARAGIDVPRAPREVLIDSLTLLEWSAPCAIVDVACSKGTYVRTLAADIGEALQCGAHLAALRRYAAGGFDIADAVDFERLEALATDDARDRLLLPVDTLLAALPRIVVDDAGAACLRHGRALPGPDVQADGLARVYDAAGRLLGVVRNDARTLVPVRMTAVAEPATED